jgi:hypothetical protein
MESMRVAFLIPHFFSGNEPRSVHGSFRPSARAIRRSVLDRAIFQIHALFGAQHCAIKMSYEDGRRRDFFTFPNLHRIEFDLYVFTTRGLHLLGELECGAGHYRHIETNAEPPFLGFECARWIRDNPGSYDFYCYLEDDIILRDPLFFTKISAFNDLFRADEHGLVLQPQRFEETLNSNNPADLAMTHRVYLDYQSRERAPFEGDILQMDFLGLRVHFEPALNPGAGCYVVNPAQAARMVNHPDFLDPDKIYISPLDTAACAFVDRALKMYKPAGDSLSFLEVQHGHPGVVRLKFES